MVSTIGIVTQIDLNKAYAHLLSAQSGAINVFVGTVRNYSNGKDVTKLVFEAYEEMALPEMNKIAGEAQQKWALNTLVMLHVKGEKKVGEVVVFIAVSSAHREASFAACRFVINELKQRVPIWKKEFYFDKSAWINAHP